MTITVSAPDGSTVSFPDNTPEATINSVMTEKFAPQAQNSLAGSAKALGVGLAEGAIGLAGLPADAVDLATRGVDALAGTKSNEAVAGLKPYGSEGIRKAIESKTGEFYKPQTTTEKYLSATASFAPAALAGPGGIGRRVATQVVAPGIASEAAGQLTAGSGYEPAARVAGALAGVAGTGRIAQALENRGAVPAVPNNQQIAQARTAGYQSQAVRDLEIDSAAANRFVDRAIQSLQRDRFSEKQAGQTYDALNGLRNAEFGATHRIQDFDSTRRILNTLAGAPGTEGEAARRAIRSIDAYTARVPTRDVVAGDARAASRALFEARGNAAANFRSERVAQLLERAVNNATATHSGGNLENEIYKQVRTWLNNPRQHLRGWNAEEIAALRSVLPDLSRGLLRRASKFLGGGGGLGQLASGAAGASMFGWPGAMALPAIGMGLNRLGSSMAERRVNAVDELLRSRAPLYGAANQAARQRALAGNGRVLGLPPNHQIALQGLLALQRPY